MKKMPMIFIILCMPFMVFAGWDDIENDVNMMEESTQVPQAPVTQEANPRYKQEPVYVPQTQPVSSPYQTSQAQPFTTRTGLGIKASTGSGEWTNIDSNYNESTGDFDHNSIALSFLFEGPGGVLEFGWGWGDIIYPNGNMRDFQEFIFQGRIGAGSTKEQSSVSPYAILGASYLFVNYGTELAPDYSFEINIPLGVGLSMKTGALEVFIEYVYSFALAGTYTNYYGDSFDVLHNHSKLSVGTAVYF